MYGLIIKTLLGLASIIQVSSSTTCDELSKETLTSIPNCNILTRLTRNNREYVKFNCSKLPGSLGAPFHLQVEILGHATDGIKERYSLCSGLFDLTAFRNIKDEPADDEAEDDEDDDSDNGVTHWHSGFNSSLPMSVILVEKKCWDQNLTCVPEFKLRKDIYDSVLFNYQPNNEKFWNFTLPIFNSPKEWFKKLHTIKYNYDFKFMKGVAETSLEEVVVYGNSDSTSELFLGPMKSLKKLHIVEGTFEEIHEGNFKNVHNLEDLSLSANSLGDIPPGISNLRKLRILDLSHYISNKKVTISLEKLGQLKSLEELNLSERKLDLVIDRLPSLENLKTLKLSKCEITSLSKKPFPFSKFPSLYFVDLSENGLTVLDSFLKPYSNIKVLNISSNSISNLPASFGTEVTLRLLNLSHNAIQEIPKLRSSNVEHFDLSHNQITNISNTGVNGMIVEHLDLSNNEITGWNDADVFLNMNYSPDPSSVEFVKVWVESLNLSYNKVEVFTKRMLGSLDNLVKVDLGENELACENCQVCHLKKWLNSNRNVSLLNLNTQTPLECRQPYNADKPFTVSTFIDENCYTDETATSVESCDYLPGHKHVEGRISDAARVFNGFLIVLTALAAVNCVQ